MRPPLSPLHNFNIGTDEAQTGWVENLRSVLKSNMGLLALTQAMCFEEHFPVIGKTTQLIYSPPHFKIFNAKDNLGNYIFHWQTFLYMYRQQDIPQKGNFF